MAALIDTATGLRPGTFGIASLAVAEGVVPALVLPDGEAIDLSGEYRGVREIFENWDAEWGRLQEIASSRESTLAFGAEGARPPVDRPDLLFAGSNYVTHVAEMLTKNRFNRHDRRAGESDEEFFERNRAKAAARRDHGTPFLFTGLHSSLTGPYDDIVLPEIGEQPDWELELGVIIGRAGRYLTLDEAERAILGYTVINDLGTVDVFRRTDVHFGYDWISKFQPTFKPIGPFVVPAPFVDIDETTIRLEVNGEPMQDWPANDYIFSPAHCIAYASERVNLRPGDVIALGSPPGNGAHHGRFLRDGDVIDSEITGLGRQRNRCVDEELHGRTPHFGLWTNPTP